MAGKILTQIYEVQTPSEAEALAMLGVDHIGSVIVSSDDWKQPVIRETVGLVRQTSSKSSLILLYHDTNLVFSSLDYYQPDIVHFCEMLPVSRSCGLSEDVICEYIKLQQAVRDHFPQIQIMRSIPIPESARPDEFPYLDLAGLFETVSDFFLTDTLLTDGGIGTDQPVSGFVGITGRTCDWRAAARLVKASRIPVILAGGLSADNVYQAASTVRPAGVDSCTHTNVLDDCGNPIRFHKDMVKVKRFVAEARRAEQHFLLDDE